MDSAQVTKNYSPASVNVKSTVQFQFSCAFDDQCLMGN